MRPKSHVTGDVGQKAVALIFAEWGWTADVIHSDYGEDLDCHVFVENQRTPLSFRCQIKSSDDAGKSLRQLKSGDFSIRIASETCRNWLLAYYPVLLVVYDCKSKSAYWADASEQVRIKIASLSKQEVTFQVSRENILATEQTQIMSVLTTFYARLYKIHSEFVERMVFPVLMPGYRVIPSPDTSNLFQLGHPRINQQALVSVHRDNLPAWTTSLRTLDGQYFSGMSFHAQNSDLAKFSEMLTEKLITVDTSLEVENWLAFVCSPIRFSIQRTEDVAESFGKDLTGWWSYAKIGNQIVSDHEYAFEPPDGFLRQIGRRARSWPGYYFVSEEFDVAIQLFAGVATTPADRLFQTTQHEHLLGQFLPWECPKSELNVLRRRLWDEAELEFSPLEDSESENGESGCIQGAITTPMFAPNIGLIPQARNWTELEQGTVRSRLERATLIEKLPGQEGSLELKNILLSRVGHLIHDVPNVWIVDGTRAELGLPIDLSIRRVIVQRFRSSSGFDSISATQVLQTHLSDLKNCVHDLDSIEVTADIFESIENIAELSVSWSPHLKESSASALQNALPRIIEVFDKVLPRKRTKASSLATSLDVLRIAGELYFQGDRMY